MDGLDQRWLGDAEFIVAGVNEYSALIDHGTHGPIKDQGLAAYFFKNGGLCIQ
jgi:hypothetical protein